MARQRVVQQADSPSARGAGEAKATPEGHGGDPSGEEVEVELLLVVWTREPGTGLLWAECPRCAAKNSEEQLAKNGNECKQCEFLIRSKAPAVDALVKGIADKKSETRVIPPVAEPRQATQLPGAEAKPGKPQCSTCGARMTEVGSGLVCPDASTSPKHRTEAVRERATKTFESSPTCSFEIDNGTGPVGHVRVTVGMITISPVDYHPFQVGPFEVQVPLGAGFEDRLRQARLDLHKIQEVEFDEQHAAYKRFLERVYPGKGRR